MDDGLLGFCGDPAANEIARQSMFLSDQIHRADNRVRHVAFEWQVHCQQIERERDLARAQLTAQIANYNQLVADFNALLDSAKRRDANADRLEANRDEWKAFALAQKERALKLEADFAELCERYERVCQERDRLMDAT